MAFVFEKSIKKYNEMMWLAQDQTPSYKTINRFRVNPNTDALIESLFIQFHNKMHIKKADFYQIINRNQLFFIA